MLGCHSAAGNELNSEGVTYESAVRNDDAGDGERRADFGDGERGTAFGDGERGTAFGDGERLLLADLGAERRGVASEVGEKGCVAVERRVLRRVPAIVSSSPRRYPRQYCESVSSTSLYAGLVKKVTQSPYVYPSASDPPVVA
eukprot:COSAG02_NODE_23545_length_715_cov_1.237013_1_plen_143_part_00